MSDVKKKILYSTDPSFVDHDKIRDLQEAEVIHVANSKAKCSAELKPLMDDILVDNPNLLPLISLENFMYFWYPKLEAYIEEGRDIVAENNPKSSIFLLWGKEHIRISQGYRVGISRSNRVEVEAETNRKKYDFEVIAVTPGLAIDPAIGLDTFKSLDLEHVATNIIQNPLEPVREFEMEEFTRDLNRVHSEEVVKSDLEDQKEEFKQEWRRVLKLLKDTYENYKRNGNYLPPKNISTGAMDNSSRLNEVSKPSKPEVTSIRKNRHTDEDEEDVEYDW